MGKAAPTADLQAAFLRNAPCAPLLDQAAYRAGAKTAIGSASVQFPDTSSAQLADDAGPLAMAALQTQALYGRATPLANLLEVPERDEPPAPRAAFWTAYSNRFVNVATARAVLAPDRGGKPFRARRRSGPVPHHSHGGRRWRSAQAGQGAAD